MKRTQPYHISMYRIMESRGFFVHQQQQQKKRLSSVDSRSIHLKSSYVLSKLFNNLASVISLPPSLTCSLWTVVNTLMRLQWHNGFIINKKQSPIDWHLMILHISFSSAFHPYFVLFLLVCYPMLNGGMNFISYESVKRLNCFWNLYAWINLDDELREHNII